MSNKLQERFIKTAPIKFKPKEEKKKDPKFSMKAKPQGEVPKPYPQSTAGQKPCSCETQPAKP
jgi:hypothetical protein